MKKVAVVVGVLALALGLWFMLDRPTVQVADDGNAATERQGAPLVEVQLPDTLSDRAELGKLAFDARCAVCHGRNAAGQDGVAPPLVHKIYEPSHHGDAAFLLAARNGVRSHHWRFGNMPPVDGLTDGDIANVVAYVRELQRANGIN